MGPLLEIARNLALSANSGGHCDQGPETGVLVETVSATELDWRMRPPETEHGNKARAGTGAAAVAAEGGNFVEFAGIRKEGITSLLIAKNGPDHTMSLQCGTSVSFKTIRPPQPRS